MTFKTKLTAAALAVSALALSQSALAAGFQLNEHSVSGLGRAFAGEGIMGDDASAAWYNPAGMTLLPGTHIQMNAVGNSMSLKYEGESGAKENGRKRISPILSQYVTHQFADRLWGGLAITMPFGLSDSYSQNWEGAERGYDGRLLVININPSIAWKINDQFSVGAGVSAEHVDAQFALKKNLLGINAFSKVDCSTWDFGWNLGAMWSPTENFRMGLSYRSKISHDAKGHVTMSTDEAGRKQIGAMAAAAAANPSAQSMVSALLKANGLSTADLMSIMSSGSTQLAGGASMDAPASAALTTVWNYSPKMRLSTSLRWTQWSSFDKLRITAADIPHSATDVQMKWRDSWFVSLGYDLDITPKWTIRGGVAYDRSPIQNSSYRTALVPDANRLWGTLGATYRPTKNWQIDMAAVHIHGIGGSDLYDNDTKTGKKIGDYSLNCYMLGAGVVYRF